MSTRRGRGTVRQELSKGQVVWEIDWRDASGKRRRRYGGRTKAEAVAVLNKVVRDRDLELAGMGAERGLSLSIAEVARLYLADLRTRARPSSVDGAQRGLELLARTLRAQTVRDLSVPLVMEWRAERVRQGASNRTANTDVGYLKAALAFVVRTGQLGMHPLAGLRGLTVRVEDQRRTARALTDFELGRLFAAAEELDREAEARARGGDGPREPPDGAAGAGQRRGPALAPAASKPAPSPRLVPLPRAPLVQALALTGARWRELTSTTWSDFDPEVGELRIRREVSKTGRARAIPMTADFVELLLTLPALYAARLGRRPSLGSPIFLSPEGRPWTKGRTNFYRHMRAVLARAGIEHRDELGRVVHVHALRHTFATRLARAEVPVATAQKLTGHRTARILLEVYTHMRDEDCRKAVEGLPGLGAVGRLDLTASERDPSGRASARDAH